MSAAYAYANPTDLDSALENQLKLSLQRVQPNPEFVGHLHDWLTTPSTTTIERRQNTALCLLLAACSLAGGVLIIWLLRQLHAA